MLAAQLTLIALLALISTADAQLIAGRLALSTEQPAPGERLEVEVLVDLSGDETGLGAYQAQLLWDERVLSLVELSDGQSQGLAGPQTRATPGEIVFSAFNAEGAKGLVSLLKARFEVVARPGQRSTLDLSFSVLDAAGSFENLLPRLQIEPAAVQIGGQEDADQVPIEFSAPDQVAPGQLFETELIADLTTSGARLGAYEAELVWDEAQLELIDANPGDEATFSTLQTRRSTGRLLFSAFSVQGATARASLLKTRFRVRGEAGQIAALALSFSALDEAGTFASLLSRIAVSPLAIPIDTLSAPSLGLEASRLLFAQTNIGQTESQTLALSNPGNQTLTISSISSDNPAFQLSQQNAIIAPGQQLAIDITFAPQTAGPKNATLTILSDDPINPAINIPLEGSGVLRSSLELSAGNLRFSETAVGRRQTRTLRLRNSGGAPLSILALSTSNDEFQLAETSALIAPGEFYSVEITFAPTIPGIKIESLVILSDDPINPERQLSLTASAVLQPNLVPSTSLLDFGETAVGNTSAQDLSLSNLGETAIRISHIAADDPSFTAAPTNAELAPGESLAVRVLFTPTTPGPKNATLTILSDDPAAPDRSLSLSASAVSLPGQGQPFAAFEASPSTGPAPLRVSFTDISTGQVTTWQWDFDDGTTSSERHPVHIFREAGNYTVRLIATGPLGSSAVAAAIRAEVAPDEPSSDFDGDGEVDFGDFFLLAEAFGKESEQEDFDASLDLVPDGKITLDDFFRFADRFGQ